MILCCVSLETYLYKAESLAVKESVSHSEREHAPISPAGLKVAISDDLFFALTHAASIHINDNSLSFQN